MAKERSGERASARERLLDAASQLFYEDGVQSVGVDRVIERAGVAKATLYSVFGSKDGLVRAYLTAHDEGIRERMARELAARYKTPRERLLGVFEVQGLRFTETGFRGCAFARASAEAPDGSSVDEVGEHHRTWLRSLFVDLAKDAAARNPEQLAQQLLLLYDGAGMSAWMDHDPSAAKAAYAVAVGLVDAALPERTQPGKKRQ
ncbi:MAG TPA: TetR/AcrR family transcriptional regulator [Mycobacterium sp.]|nr:TetR/AcrR family transcriptional regulator [Mycobacterium sp.]